METLSQICPGGRMKIVEIPRRCPLRIPLEQFGIIQGSILYCCYCSPGAELVALEHEGTVIAVRLCELSGITTCYCL